MHSILKSCLLLTLLSQSAWAADISLEAQNLFKQALESNSSGDYPTALSYYIQSYNADPDVLGLQDEGLLENSTRYFEEYLKDHSGDVNSLMWLASIATMQGNFQKSIDYYQKVVLYAPNSDEAVQADKEILRMESILKGKKDVEQQKFQDRMEQSQLEDKIRTNLTSELEARYRSEIERLKAEIDTLKRQLYDAEQKAETLAKNQQDTSSQVEQLQEDNEHNRKMYLYYLKKNQDR